MDFVAGIIFTVFIGFVAYKFGYLTIQKPVKEDRPVPEVPDRRVVDPNDPMQNRPKDVR